MNLKTSKQDRRETRASEWKRFFQGATQVYSDAVYEGSQAEEITVEGAWQLGAGESEESSDSQVEGLVLWREKSDDGRLTEIWYLHRPLGPDVVGQQCRIGDARFIDPNEARRIARELRRDRYPGGREL
jgi:hypothetical protein